MRRRLPFAVLAVVLAFAACTSDTTSSPDPATPAPTDARQEGTAATALVEVDGYVYADPPEAWRNAFDAVQAITAETVESAVRTVRRGEEAVAVIWVTVVEQARELDDVPSEELRAQAEADAMAEYDGSQEAQAQVKVFGGARVVHTQPSDEPWPHIYFWPVRPSTTIRFMGDDPVAIETYIEAFVAAS